MKEVPKNNIERIILRIETLMKNENPSYFADLFTNIYILAKLKNDKKAIAELEELYNQTATFNDRTVNLSALQTLDNYYKKTDRGHLKSEGLMIRLEIDLKMIYYALVHDMDIDIIKKGADLDKIKPI